MIKKGRLIAIGDIHGEAYKLSNLLEKIKPTKEDFLVFLGDYIDRGLYSKEVIETLIKLEGTCNCEFLIGNHEYFLLKAANGDMNSMANFMMNGGVQTNDSYGCFENILKTHGEFFKKLKYYYKTDEYLFVHAGIRPDKSLELQEEFDMVIIRDNFISKTHQLNQKVIFGHTPFKDPHIEDDKIGIDTGCGKYSDSPLTAIICKDKEEFIYSS